MTKQEKEFFSSDNIDWDELKTHPVDKNERSSLYQTKTLSKDIITGDTTLILNFLPNYLSGENNIIHDYWEEVYILDGELTDINLKETFGKNHYACRPPGMKHGPYEITSKEKGCKMLVTIRYI